MTIKWSDGTRVTEQELRAIKVIYDEADPFWYMYISDDDQLDLDRVQTDIDNDILTLCRTEEGRDYIWYLDYVEVAIFVDELKFMSGEEYARLVGSYTDDDEEVVDGKVMTSALMADSVIQRNRPFDYSWLRHVRRKRGLPGLFDIAKFTVDDYYWSYSDRMKLRAARIVADKLDSELY